MSELRFGPGTLRLAAIAAQSLGWRPDEFWQATPAELATALRPPQSGSAGLDSDDLKRMMEANHD